MRESSDKFDCLFSEKIMSIADESNGSVDSRDAFSLAKSLYRISQILPDDQQLKVIPSATLARDALNLMAEHG